MKTIAALAFASLFLASCGPDAPDPAVTANKLNEQTVADACHVPTYAVLGVIVEVFRLGDLSTDREQERYYQLSNRLAKAVKRSPRRYCAAVRGTWHRFNSGR